MDSEVFFIKNNSNDGKKLHREWRRAGRRYFFGFILRFLVFLVLLLAVLLDRMFVGPSSAVSSMLTMSLLESSALKFVPYLYLPEHEVDRIVDSAKVKEVFEETDTSLIIFPEAIEKAAEEKDLEIIKVSGPTYKGQVMIIRDPSRVFLGVTNNIHQRGMYITELAEKYDAIAAINASGFSDAGGMSDGRDPLGMVISEGQLLSKGDKRYTTAAFDNNNILHVGVFTAEDVETLGLRDAAAWGPALIQNGVPMEVSESTGLNPRTAIGQRSDGAVLFVVLDGRYPSSLGATYSDIISVMSEYGAVNACNLDGGFSSVLLYEGERISDVASIDNIRRIPTAFMVRRLPE